MTTRFYTRNEAALFTPATLQGAWDQSGVNVSRRMDVSKAGVATSTISDTETSSNTAWDVLLARFISDPLRAQTISGTVDWVLWLTEGSITVDGFLHVHIWVTVGDSDTVRGTLYTDWVDTVECPSGSPGTATAKSDGAQAITSVNCLDGDRIVVETGMQVRNSSSSSQGLLTLRYGGSGADVTNGSSTTTDVPWIEFSDTIIFRRTKLYVNNAANPVNPGSFQGSWNIVGGAVKKQLGFDKSSGGVITNTTVAEVSATSPWDVLAQQFVSPAIAASVFSGDFEIVLGVRESSGSADAFLRVYCWIMEPGGSNRGAVIDTVSATENTTTAGAEGRRITGTLNTVMAQDGDRIVLEVGSRYTNTVTTSFNSVQYYGGSASSPLDLSSGGTQTSGNAGGYISFPNDISLAGARGALSFYM